MLLLQALVLGLSAINMAAQAQRSCTTVSVSPCTVSVDRDLMFLVDASDSLDPARFQSDMLDYTQSLYCAFRPQDINRAGMITFANQITERIPLDRYTPTQWFAKVEEIRVQNLCCSCCTPTAEAFDLARQVFQAVPIGNAIRIVFTVTDGAPWQNEGAVVPGQWDWPIIESAKYTWGIVPQVAAQLKAMHGENRVRIIMVGVPNKQGNPPRIEYFQGKPDPTKAPSTQPTVQCNIRGNKKTCADMKLAPFPIVSEPTGKNTFASRTWNVQRLLDNTVGTLCEVLPTPAPTRAPTTLAPTRTPTQPPTFPPTRGPTPPPTNAPTFAPTKQPTRTPSRAPSRSPSSAPIKPELDGLDMYILLDRSRSMRWVPDLCRAAPGGNPQDSDAVACWHLFLKFVQNLVGKVANIPYRDTVLGWKDSFGATPKRGLRIWVYAFACTGHQSIPVVLPVGEKVGSLAAFNSAMALANSMIPDGGTCPGAAIEKIAATIQGTDLLTRIYKTAILMTDGVFYDMPRPRIASQALFHFGVLTYSMGIAIPSDGNDWGLTAAEIVRQRTQLMHFVEDDESRLFNFGLEGLNLLDEIATELAAQLPRDAVNNLPDVSNNPYWCGWTSIERCTEMDESKTATGLYCYWNTKQKRCMPKGWCKYDNKSACQKDQYCEWSWPKCVAKAGVPT